MEFVFSFLGVVLVFGVFIFVYCDCFCVGLIVDVWKVLIMKGVVGNRFVCD